MYPNKTFTSPDTRIPECLAYQYQSLQSTLIYPKYEPISQPFMFIASTRFLFRSS